MEYKLPYDDVRYTELLEEFSQTYRAEYRYWRGIEQRLFEGRIHFGSARGREIQRENAQLWHQIDRFVAERWFCRLESVSSSAIRRILSGRILRGLLDSTPHLHPAPGQFLITLPRTLWDRELTQVIACFSQDEPEIWQHWLETEWEKDFDDRQLHPVSTAFARHVHQRHWVQHSTAITYAFFDARIALASALEIADQGGQPLPERFKFIPPAPSPLEPADDEQGNLFAPAEVTRH